MTILYNEESLSAHLYQHGFSNGIFNFREGLLVAKYMRHVLGYKDSKTKTQLISFCKSKDPFFRYENHLSLIKDIVRKSKSDFLNRDKIVIFYSEIGHIREKIRNFNAQKLFLGMLLFVKRNNFNFISLKQWKNIKKIMKINLSNKKIYELIHLLYLWKMLIPVRKKYDAGHSLIWDVLPDKVFFQAETDADLLTLESKYRSFCGGQLGYCEICQAEFVKTNFRQKYCVLHKTEKRLEKNRKYNQKR